MSSVSGVVPARFLTLTAHTVLTISIFLSRDDNIRACLPLKFDDKEYDRKDTQFIVALSLSLACLALEYFGFFGGVSTFLPVTSLISTCLHSSACVALAFFTWDIWDCDLYWYIFGFCCAMPALGEVVALITVFGLRKNRL